MTHTLKEARLQKSVLKNMNRIGGMTKRMRYHSLSKSQSKKLRFCHVDPAGIDGRNPFLLGEVLE